VVPNTVAKVPERRPPAPPPPPPAHTPPPPPPPTIKYSTVGDGGAGVEPAEALDKRLSPAAFTAEILKKYCVPFVKPVTVADVAFDTPSAKSVYDPPADVEK
jgi:hypothetical protein